MTSEETLPPILPWKDTARRWPSMKQEGSPHQTLNLLAPGSWTFKLRTVKRNTCSNHQSWYFCYSFTNGLRHKLIPKVNVGCNNYLNYRKWLWTWVLRCMLENLHCYKWIITNNSDEKSEWKQTTVEFLSS